MCFGVPWRISPHAEPPLENMWSLCHPPSRRMSPLYMCIELLLRVEVPATALHAAEEIDGSRHALLGAILGLGRSGGRSRGGFGGLGLHHRKPAKEMRAELQELAPLVLVCRRRLAFLRRYFAVRGLGHDLLQRSPHFLRGSRRPQSSGIQRKVREHLHSDKLQRRIRRWSIGEQLAQLLHHGADRREPTGALCVGSQVNKRTAHVEHEVPVIVIQQDDKDLI
mmetsp:Transcript_8496/g.18517  ORF Transcript_8496/g.18517 Transcript_8496/m.18517 type:complete len:223 (+) Transcript_8496:26-694(+)